MLGYCRQILRLNDEAWQRMTHHAFEGRVRFGVPEDHVLPFVSPVMRDFAADFPRVRISLTSSITRKLIEQFDEGRLDVILTTEPVDTGTGECLYRGTRQPDLETALAAAGGEAGLHFPPVMLAALERAGIPWESPYEANHWRDLEAFVRAGLATESNMSFVLDRDRDRVPVPADSGLPPLQDFGIFLYIREGAPDLALQFAGIVRDTNFAPETRKPHAIQ